VFRWLFNHALSLRETPAISNVALSGWIRPPAIARGRRGMQGWATRVLRAGGTRAIGRCVALEGRRPRLLLRFSGVLLLRFAERAFEAALLKLPPRFTRLEAPWVLLPSRARPRTRR